MGRYEQAPQPRFADEEPDFGYAGSETYMDDRWSDAPMTDDEILTVRTLVKRKELKICLQVTLG